METEIATITEDQLKRLEDKVRRGAAAFIETGQALSKIREGKGYRLRGYDTFEAYCSKEFGITDRHGRRLIQSAETAVEVKKITGTAPASEFVAREYAALVEDPDQLKRVVAQMEKKGFSVVTATAETVKETVQQLAPKPKPSPIPSNGKSVVLPSVGFSAKQAAKVMSMGAKHTATPVKLEAPDGACPHCGERPDRYEQSEETWECGNCHGIVMLNVIKWPPEDVQPAQGGPVCPHCRKPIGDGDPFCNSCGCALE